MRTRLSAAAALLSCAIACSGSRPSRPAGQSARVPIGELPVIDTDALLAATRILASDEFEGRAPGSKGEDLTVRFLVDQFTKLGLKPGNTDGSFVQRVPLVGMTPSPAPLVFTKGAARQTLRWKDDVVAWTKHVAARARLQNSELVFVGYGASAPEYDWDDYKGEDLRGKTLVMLVGDPPVPDPANPSALDPKIFGGAAMTYYGRWTYKYEIGAEKGAAGVIIIHETGPAGYPFAVVQTKAAEQFDLVVPDKNMWRVPIEGWITLERGRGLFEMAGADFDALKAAAATRAFKPVSLGATASMSIDNRVRTIASRNVVAKLEGSDARLKDEYVIYVSHWDHLGIGSGREGDRIYNGAQDNAVGVAGLVELARAFTKLPVPPKQSILFVSTTAEEQGLLGSRSYAVSQIYPLARTLAAINIDGLNVHGRTRDVTLIGYGASDLDDYVRDAAGEQGRVVRPDAEPEKGGFYRSDHFNFAKRGVPALDPDQGVDFIGRPAGFGPKIRSEYTERDYHKPSDEVQPGWDLAGAREDLEMLMAVGYRVAQAEKFPEWKQGTEFRAKREAMLKR